MVDLIQFYSLVHRGDKIMVYKKTLDGDSIFIGVAQVWGLKDGVGTVVKELEFRDGTHWGAANKCVVALDAFREGIKYARG